MVRDLAADLVWQPSLLDGLEVAAARRHELGHGAWVDIAPGWCASAEELFARLLAETPWGGPRRVRMYDRVVSEPRLTHRWPLAEAPPDLAAMARELSARYGVEFTQVGANLYRDGADSVAWHGDRVAASCRRRSWRWSRWVPCGRSGCGPRAVARPSGSPRGRATCS